MRKTWTPELDEQLTELRRQGMSAGQIGKAMGRSRGSISSRMHALGLFGRSESRPWGRQEVDHLCTHYRHPDWPVKRLAELYGRSRSAVRMKAAYLGLQRPELDYKAKPPEMDRRIVTLAMADMPSEDIAATVGCCPAYVAIVMRRRPYLHKRWKDRLGMRRRKSPEREQA